MSHITPIPDVARIQPLFAHGKYYVRNLKSEQTVPKNKLRIKIMAASMTTGFSISASASAIPAARVRTRRRSITPQAGHALELLAHAIEYLTDEFVHQGLAFSARNEQLEAVQMLMALNRQVYFECPEVPSISERFRALLHFHSA